MVVERDSMIVECGIDRKASVVNEAKDKTYLSCLHR